MNEYLGKSKTSRIRLEFDAQEDPTLCTRYFHFLFGYLLPAVDYASSHKDAAIEMQSCGPLMDEVTTSTFEALQIKVSIAEVATTRHVKKLARYDLQMLLDSHLRNETRHILPRIFKRSLKRLSRGNFRVPPRHAEVIAMVKRNKCRLSRHWTDPGTYAGKVLLLQRSPPHKFYAVGGSVRSRGYGTDRRAIENMDELEETMLADGLDVIRFEPGAHSLIVQTQAFAECSAVVGIRGAEYANVVWMSAGARVVVYDRGLPGRTPTQRVARSLGIEWFDFDISSLHLEEELIKNACKLLSRQ